MRRIVINNFYESASGYIVRLYGYRELGGTTSYDYVDNQGKRGSINGEDIYQWNHRPDLRDYPDARDPILPSLFDLHWDLKTKSDLERVLRFGNGEDIAEIRAAAIREKIDVDPSLLAEGRVPAAEVETGAVYLTGDGRRIVVNALKDGSGPERVWNFYDESYRYGEADEAVIAGWTLLESPSYHVVHEENEGDPNSMRMR